jgi:hypothetical protein
MQRGSWAGKAQHGQKTAGKPLSLSSDPGGWGGERKEERGGSDLDQMNGAFCQHLALSFTH